VEHCIHLPAYKTYRVCVCVCVYVCARVRVRVRVCVRACVSAEHHIHLPAYSIHRVCVCVCVRARAQGVCVCMHVGVSLWAQHTPKVPRYATQRTQHKGSGFRV